MSNSHQQQETPRVLVRIGSRILTRDDIERVSGGQNQTFAFTHFITDDVTRD